ncbi:DNA mismatch repair protein MutS [Anaerosalibacter sp. Marseille-P3206]|uniref:DNA mismatch repair protein MutS n=1 Tax=Anaerosalibacter sp. Marseille-P3206 TaxID=1871005 RepID=UPI0009853E63|nr:DNA mismatch repair protein MutS [Anaerosalibacter sp. Marseille-P3206]
MDNLTPMMKQYTSVKSKYNDCILFFRLGDFYEMFFEDALKASKELEITLTKRECGQKEKAPMCGVPYHAADSYISKLIEKGYKVAICEQLEDPATAKGIVKRDVIRVITPGTIMDSKVLDEKTNNYLASVFMDDKGVGISYVDISTGELYTTEFKGNIKNNSIALLDELGKIIPSEIIVNSIVYENQKLKKTIENKINPYIAKYRDEDISYKSSNESIMKYFDKNSIDCFKDINGKVHSVVSTGILLDYLQDTQKMTTNHINNISYYSIDNYMALDLNTRINLEINETIRGKEKKGSLIWLLDKTSTAMGGRLLKRWLEQPLLNIKDIEYRLDIIETFTDDIILMDEIKGYLKDIYDLERIMGKIAYGNCNGRDLICLKNSIEVLPSLKQRLMSTANSKLIQLGESIDPLNDLYILIDNSIVDDPPITIKDGGIIKPDFNSEISELRDISTHGKEWLAKLEDTEKQKTGIKTLKIGYNKVFGYYIDVTKSYLNLVPEYYIRKQTLSNSERYITPELKEMEAKILGAEEKLVELEYEVFIQVRDMIKNEMERVQMVSKIIAKIDGLNSLSQVAYTNNYVRPELNNDGIIEIKNGRHPVVEKMLKETMFVPNDTYLNRDKQRVLIITGPNMAGKSTYMRQVAIITLMAQVGSFVPAEYANIGVVDRIFTRIGASDNLSQGESTFMVEMNEVSNIIQNATKDSLIILDEVGRGTSTFDGLSIAWSVIEYIANNIKAKTLFATHYHELTKLEEDMEGIVNYNILVEEKGEEIIFLRKIVRGGTDRSYGIEVARLAGINDSIIKRAREILKSIENQKNNNITIKESDNDVSTETSLEQISFFDNNNKKFIDKIKNIDVIKLTPMDTMNILYDLVEEAKKL